MNYHALFKNKNGKKVRVALVGVGDFGATLIDQSRSIDRISITVICDKDCLLYTSPSPRDLSTSRMPSSA